MLMLLVIVVVCSYVIYAVPLKEVLNQSYQIKARLAEAGYAGPVIFTLGALTDLLQIRMHFIMHRIR